MALSALVDPQAAVASLVAAGCDLAEIEGEIDETESLDEEARSALWLLAWSCTDPDFVESSIDPVHAG